MLHSNSALSCNYNSVGHVCHNLSYPSANLRLFCHLYICVTHICTCVYCSKGRPIARARRIIDKALSLNFFDRGLNMSNLTNRKNIEIAKNSHGMLDHDDWFTNFPEYVLYQKMKFYFTFLVHAKLVVGSAIFFPSGFQRAKLVIGFRKWASEPKVNILRRYIAGICWRIQA